MTEENNPDISILIICENPKKYRLVIRQLSSEGWALACVSNVKKALQIMLKEPPTHVFLSYNTKGISVAKISKMIATTFNAPVILFPEDYDYQTSKMMREIKWNHKLSNQISVSSVKNKIREIMGGRLPGEEEKKEESSFFFNSQGDSTNSPSKKKSSASNKKDKDDEDIYYHKPKKRAHSKENIEEESSYQKQKKLGLSSEDDDGETYYSKKKKYGEASESDDEASYYQKKKKYGGASEEEEDTYYQKKKFGLSSDSNEDEDGYEEEFIEVEDIDWDYDDEVDDTENIVSMKGHRSQKARNQKESAALRDEDENETLEARKNQGQKKKASGGEDYSYDEEYLEEDERIAFKKKDDKGNKKSHKDYENSDDDNISSLDAKRKAAKQEKAADEDEEYIEKASHSVKKGKSSAAKTAWDDESDEEEEIEAKPKATSQLKNKTKTKWDDESDEEEELNKKAKSSKENTKSNNEQDNQDDTLSSKGSQQAKAKKNDAEEDEESDLELSKRANKELRQKDRVDYSLPPSLRKKHQNIKQIVEEDDDGQEDDEEILTSSGFGRKKRTPVLEQEREGADKEEPTFESHFKDKKENTTKDEEGEAEGLNSEFEQSKVKKELNEVAEETKKEVLSDQKLSEEEKDERNQKIKQILQKSLHTSIEPSGNLDIPHKEVDQFVAYHIESETLNGLIYLSFAKDITASGVVGSMLKTLKQNFSEENISIQIHRPVIVNSGSVQLKQFLDKRCDYLIGADHQGEEVLMGFLECNNVCPAILPSPTDDMFMVDVKDFPTENGIDFNLYIYLPVNKKYIRYIAPEGKLTEMQKNRLGDKKVSAFHIKDEDVLNVKDYFIKKFTKEGLGSE